jgi:hypothetical protein
MYSSVDFTVVINSHLSVEIHRLKAMFSIALSVNTSCNVFSKLVGPGQSLQSRKKQFVWVGLQITVERQCWYVERQWCLLLLVSSDILRASNINFTFWWIVHTHTLCVPLAPAIIQFLGCKGASFRKHTLTPGCGFLKWEYNSFKLHNNNRFCSCISTPLTLIDM